MGFNRRLFTVELSKQTKPIYAKVRPFMEKAFEERKEKLLDLFEEDEVTQSLRESAADSSHSDGIVNTAHGGSLYTFIGVPEGEDPASELREVLEKDIKLNLSQIKREVREESIVFRIPVRVPTLATVHSKMAKAVPLGGWTARGFTDLIERGVSGFRRFLFDGDRTLKGSRSGHGIQVKDKTLRGGGFGKIRYVSKLLDQFRELISGKR